MRSEMSPKEKQESPVASWEKSTFGTLAKTLPAQEVCLKNRAGQEATPSGRQLKGNCKWIRIPVVIYATHTITVAVACLAQILFADFSNAQVSSPGILEKCLPISAAFAPFLVVPLLMLLLVLFSPAYNQVEKEKKK
uniref:EXPERA domain-containing protein n=1 Tax=Naja naja TaxID=35670 RepID=A0A8C6V563_NAJNA